jgi:hypothetical protein
MLIAGALGLDPTVTNADEIGQVISRIPETLVELSQIETCHEAELQNLVIESHCLQLADAADARTRQIA